jgi:hypothetical protein
MVDLSIIYVNVYQRVVDPEVRHGSQAIFWGGL